MQTATVITKTELSRRTRQVVERVRRGQTIIIQGQKGEQAVIIDILDFRLLRAMAAYQNLPPHLAPVRNASLGPRGLNEQETEEARTNAGGDVQAVWNLVITSYLDGDISLGRTAQLLGLSRFELAERFNRLAIPLRLGAMSVNEARAGYEAIRDKA
jgi:prevent-host-death family protein